MEDYKPVTDKDKISFLMAKDERRDGHIKELQNDVKGLTSSIRDLTTAIVGSPMNGNKGFVQLFEKIDEKVDEMEKSIEKMKSDIDTGKFWGKGLAGVIFITIGLIIKKLSDL